jgi:hypothetical protein
VVGEEAPVTHTVTLHIIRELCCMFLGSGIRCGHSAGGATVVDGHAPRAQEGNIMQLLILVIVAIVGVGLFRYLRTRTAH